MLAFGGVLLSAGQVAQSQEAPSLERVTIIGSNIKRVEAAAPTVVQTIRPADIEKTGATTVNEVFMNLPGFRAYNEESNATSAPSRSSVQFRNFDETNVLVLVNGRRISRNAVNGSAYDLNSIPAAAIERVEILKDGAAAIYGSDAVSGVVNFVLKRDLQGGTATVAYGDALSNHDGTERRLSAAYGFGSLEEDGYNFLLTGDYFQRDVVLRRDRAPTAFRKGPGQYNEAAPTGNLQDATVTGGNFTPINACKEDLVTDQQGTYCPYYFNVAINLIPKTERGGFFSAFTKKLGANTTAFAEVMATKASTQNAFSAPPGRFRNVTVPAGGVTLADGTVIPAGQVVELIRVRYDQNGVRRFLPKAQALRVVTGVEGAVGGFDYAVDVGRSQTKTSELSTGFFDYASAQADVNAGTFNPFIVPLAADISKYNVAGTTATKTSLTFVNAHGSLQLGELGGGAAAVAAGYSGGRESLDIMPDDISEAGRVSATGTGVVPLKDAKRTIQSVYSELSLPFMKGVETQAAVRFDHYSDFGNVVTPKLAAKWTVVPALAFRASFGKGFIAPNLEDLYRDGIESAEFVRDTAQCKAQNIAPEDCVVDQIDTTIRSNKDLKPEKSTTISLGFVAAPLPQLSLQADYFSIKKTGRIDTSLQYLIDNPDAIVAGKKASDYITRSGTGAIQFADSPKFNTGDEKSTGIELGVVYRTDPAPWGRLTFDNQTSYYIRYAKAQAPGTPLLGYLGLMDYPRYRNVYNMTYEISDLSLTTYVRTMGGFYDAQEPTEVTADTKKIGAFTTIDFQIGVANLLSKGSRFSIGMKNALNTKPTQSDNDNNSGFPTSQSAVGRFLYSSFSVPF
jgi:iron complex outermembrane receptor protein